MLYDTKILLERARPLERAGHWQSAIDLCEEVFARSVAASDLESICEAVLRIGLCYRQTGESELALEHLDLALTMASANGDLGRSGRALNGMAALYHSHGEVDKAELHYKQAQGLAREVNDVLTCGNIDQNLGALAGIRGDTTEALSRYHAALHSYEEIGHERGIAGVQNNLGIMYIHLGDYTLGGQHLERALASTRKIGDVLTEGIICINQADMYLAVGDLTKARACCDEAYEIVSRTGEHATRADVLKLYGIIYRESEKYYLAEHHLRESIAVSSANTFPLEEAQAQRELALVLRRQDRNREALVALNRAHSLFQHVQARHWQTDVGDRITKLQEDFLSLVRAWGESIEAKDRYTSGHCERVSDYACRIAELCGMSEQDLVWFRMGAFLHDVGKTEVPEEILNKPGRLTDEEREVIEQHTVIGDEILSTIEFPWDIRPMVRSHHERWDGRGYPDGLRGESIPLNARILRIADIFDALTTSRSYRQPLTPEQAFQIMQDDHGSFDPHLFEVFRNLFSEFGAMVGGDASRR